MSALLIARRLSYLRRQSERRACYEEMAAGRGAAIGYCFDCPYGVFAKGGDADRFRAIGGHDACTEPSRKRKMPLAMPMSETSCCD